MSINRILLPFIGQFRNVKIDGMDATIRDGSALSFQVQEMIASGACKRVLRDDELSQRFTERLHPTLIDPCAVNEPTGELAPYEGL